MYYGKRLLTVCAVSLGLAGTFALAQISVPSSGIISTIAGTGPSSYTGDGDQAVKATLSVPLGVAVDASGNIYIADFTNNVIRKITASTGVISTVAGSEYKDFQAMTGPLRPPS